MAVPVTNTPTDVENLSMLIYTSIARHDMPQPELMDILKVSRKNNEKRNVTGMLLYKSGNFLQVLEGSDEAISALYEVIRYDPRHHQVSLVYKRPIPKRDFGQWEMGFTNLSDDNVREIIGFNSYLLQTIATPKLIENNSVAHIFLDAFRHVMR